MGLGGKKSTGHDQSGLTPAQKKTHNRIVRDVTEAEKTRLQKNVKATNKDGNKKAR